MKTKFLILLFVLIFSTLSASVSAETYLPYNCVFSEFAPVIDGVINESEWAPFQNIDLNYWTTYKGGYTAGAMPWDTATKHAEISLMSSSTHLFVCLKIPDDFLSSEYPRRILQIYLDDNQSNYLDRRGILLENDSTISKGYPTIASIIDGIAYRDGSDGGSDTILGGTMDTIVKYSHTSGGTSEMDGTYIFEFDLPLNSATNDVNDAHSSSLDVKISYSEWTQNYEQSTYWRSFINIDGTRARVDQSSVSDDRCDIGSSQIVRFHARWENGTAIKNGSIKINDDNTLFNGTGWASLSEISNVPAKRVYFIKAVNCSGVTDFNQTTASPSIIWDRVDVTLNIVDNRIDVGLNAAIEWSATYAFDGTPFKGSVVFSSPLRGDLPDDVPGQSLHLDDVGKARFTADAIRDDQYGLTWFTTNSVDCVWDRVRITQGGVSSQLTKTGNMETVWFKAVYEYDYSSFTGEPTTNGDMNKITVNGIPLVWSSYDKEWKYSTKLDENGKLTFEVTGVEDMQYKLTKFVDDAGPQSITWEKPFLETPVGITSVVAVLAVIVAGAIFFLRKRV